jgi:hypothetical protein
MVHHEMLRISQRRGRKKGSEDAMAHDAGVSEIHTGSRNPHDLALCTFPQYVIQIQEPHRQPPGIAVTPSRLNVFLLSVSGHFFPNPSTYTGPVLFA